MEKQIMGYAIKRKLGKGAFGEVFLVADKQGNLFAAKCMTMTPQMIEGQFHEALLHASLDHPSLLKAHKALVYEEEMALVILTEYCDQGSLADLIENISKLVPDKEKKQIFLQRTMLEVAKGIEHLHCDRKIIHRDLKPENIFMKDCLPKIGDFGLSKPADNIAMTQCGTPWYMALEQMVAKKYGYQVDIWALGIIFLEILLEKRIYNLLEGLQQPCNRSDFPSRTLLAALPSDKARDLIKAMLKTKPQERPGIKEIVKYLGENYLYSSQKQQNQVVAVIDQKHLEAIINMMVAIQVRKAHKNPQPDPKPVPKPSNPDPKPSNPMYIRVGTPYKNPNPARPAAPASPPKPVPKPKVVPLDPDQSSSSLRITQLPETFCKQCNGPTEDVQTLKSGRAAYVCCCVLFFTIPFLSCVPFCTEKYKDRVRVCRVCGEDKARLRAESICDCCSCCCCEDCCWD